MEEKIYLKDEEFKIIMNGMDKAIKKAEEFIDVVDVMQATTTAMESKYEGKIYFTEQQMIQLISKSNKLDRILLPFINNVAKK